MKDKSKKLAQVGAKPILINGVDRLKRFSAHGSQSSRFVGERSPTVQYLIDVLAMAFILALALTLIGGSWK